MKKNKKQKPIKKGVKHMKNVHKKALLRAGVIALLIIMVATLLITPALAAVTPPVDPPVTSGGEPFITGYTVTDAAGNEIQRVAPNQKTRIVVSIVDPRIMATDYGTGKKAIPQPNFKITTLASFASPTLGDITNTTIGDASLTADGLKYAVIFNDITYLGGDNKLEFDLSYTDNGRALTALSQKISQCIADGAEASGASSTAIIKDVNYGEGSIKAGSNFTLTASIFAAGGVSGLKNVSVNVTLPEQVTVANGSTNLFVGDIKAGETKKVSFELTASAVANAGSYSITVGVTGTSASKEDPAPSATMPVTVRISQPERFEINRVNFSEFMNLNEDGYLNISLINKGKGSIFNVSAEFVGTGIECPEGNLFIGNITAGTENSSDIMFRATTAGTVKGVLTIKYEDDAAKEKTLTKEITLTVQDNSMGGGGMDIAPPDIITDGNMPAMAKPGMPWWGWLLIIIVVIAIVVATIIILKKQKAKKLAAKLLEDDDEDI